MSLNVKNIGGKIDNLEPASYPARLVQVIDLGMQKQSYNGEQKKPLREIYLTYELADEFMKDEDGQPIPEKPRWISESFPLYNLKSEKAKSSERYNSLDPQGVADGDFTKLIGNPLMITVVNNVNKVTKKTYDNVAGTQPMRTKDAEKLSPMVNEGLVWLLDDPDLERFLKFPPFLKKRITDNLNFAGSKLEAMLKEVEGGDQPPKEERKSVTTEEERPF